MESSFAKNTKILYIITKSNFGGAQRYVLDMATSISKMGFDVCVAQGGTGKRGTQPGLLFKKFSQKNIRTIFIKHFVRDIFIFEDIAAFFEILKVLQKERPDIIHINSSKAAGISALAGRIMGIKKIIYTVHGWPHNENRNFISRLLIIFASWTTVLLSTHVIVITTKDLNAAKKFPFLSKRVQLIPNGIECGNILNKSEARKKIDIIMREKKFPLISSKKTIVGTIAELTPNKGLSYAVSAFTNKNLDTQYIVIGDGEDKEKLRTLIKNESLYEKVSMLEFIENAENFIKAFDIFLLPSIKEGSPYVILEALCAGVPIIATSAISLSDYPEGADITIIPAKDPVAISKAIQSRISNDNLYVKDFSRVMQNLYNKMIEKTQRVYLS